VPAHGFIQIEGEYQTSSEQTQNPRQEQPVKYWREKEMEVNPAPVCFDRSTE